MNFIKLSENSQFKKDYKNIVVLTNKYVEDKDIYDNILSFQQLELYNDKSLNSDYLGNFLDKLNFFIVDETTINYFKTLCSSSDFPFDLIILNQSLFNANFFDYKLFKLIVEISNLSHVKIIFGIDNNISLLDSFYDDSNNYLLKTVIQGSDLIITSNNKLMLELINFNDYIIELSSLKNLKYDSTNFYILFKKWCILLKSIFNNDFILDVIIEYSTEIVEYDVIHNSNKENKYKISVIIPIHNTGEKLRRTLRSIEYQTIGIEYIEVLMINDCSTDTTTINILNEFVQKNNFKLIDLKENQGRPGIPRNIGIKESSAEYIMFLDHDDFFEISALERLFNEMNLNETNNLDLVFGTYSTVVNERASIYFDKNDKNGYIDSLTESPRLIAYPPPSIWTKLFKKEVIIRNNILFPHILGEDAMFMDKFLLYAKGIKYLQKALIAFHDLGKQSITNNVTLRYLREGILSEIYLKDYFESVNKSEYSKIRVDVLAYFFLKKFLDSNLTEKEIRLIFPKYHWAMKQINEYGSDIIYNKEVFETILSNDLEKLIKIKLPQLNKQNIMYITILDETNSFPLINSLDELLDEVNIYALTYTDFKIKLWSCNLDTFNIIKEIKFHDRVPNFNQLNAFYNDIFDNFSIDKLFFRHFGLNDRMFYFRSMLQTQKITPLTIASDRNIPTIYGKNSEELLNKLDFKYHTSNNLDPANEKGVVYTAIFGDYEPLLDPKVIDENLDYICFTDNPNLKSDIWTVKTIPDFINDFNFVDNFNNKSSFNDLDYTRKARAIKILPHLFLKEYDFSIWIDAGFLIVGDVIKFVNRYTEKDFLGVTHSTRHCLYDEADEVLRLGMDNNELILKQIERYKKDKYPRGNGLIESGILFRRHNNLKIIDVMEDWFSEILNYSKRDQISFNYVAWKNNLDFDLANMYCTRNPYFHHYFHRIKSIVNNKATLKDFRVILLDNTNLENIKFSINEINKINDYIPISIVTNNKKLQKNLNYDAFNIEVLHSKKKINSEIINYIISKKTEKFIHIINAGEILDYEFILKNI